MLRVAPIRFTSRFDDWRRLLEALGMRLATESEGWLEFDSLSGRVRLHSPDDDRPAGSTRLAFEVGDVQEFARRTRLDGTDVVVTEEGHGTTATIEGTDGISFVATAEQRAPEASGADPLLHVLPLWVSPTLDDAATVLRHIGARPDDVADSEGWRQFRAKNGGRIAVHTGDEPGVVLSFQYDGDADNLIARLHAVRLGASITEQPHGRTVLVEDPDGGEHIWINEHPGPGIGA